MVTVDIVKEISTGRLHENVYHLCPNEVPRYNKYFEIVERKSYTEQEYAIKRIQTSSAKQLDKIMADYIERMGKTEEWADSSWDELYTYEGDVVAKAASERCDFLVQAGGYDSVNYDREVLG